MHQQLLCSTPMLAWERIHQHQPDGGCLRRPSARLREAVCTGKPKGDCARQVKEAIPVPLTGLQSGVASWRSSGRGSVAPQLQQALSR